MWFPIDSINNANIKYSKFWVSEYVPSRFITRVNEASVNEYPPSVNAYLLRKYIWDFEQVHFTGISSSINSNNHPDEWADFILVDSNRMEGVELERFNVLDFDPISGQRLLEQKYPNQEKFTRDTVLYDLRVQNEFTNIFDLKGENWINKPMAIYLNMDVQGQNEILQFYPCDICF